jgi:hypothetical protein
VRLPLGPHPAYDAPLLIEGRAYAFKSHWLTSRHDYYLVTRWCDRQNRLVVRWCVPCLWVQCAVTADEAERLAQPPLGGGAMT